MTVDKKIQEKNTGNYGRDLISTLTISAVAGMSGTYVAIRAADSGASLTEVYGMSILAAEAFGLMTSSIIGTIYERMKQNDS